MSRRGSVSFDKKPAQVVTAGKDPEAVSSGEEEEGEGEEEEEEEGGSVEEGRRECGRKE